MAELPSYYQNAADRSWLNAALTVTQIGTAGFTILLRASHAGSSFTRFVFPFYQNCIGFLVLAPLAFFFEREQRPDLRFSTVCRLFILGSIGVVINQVSYVTSLSSLPSYAFPPLPSAINSITPLVTFLLAAACWLEEIDIRRPEGQAKLLGIIVSCIGAVLMYLGFGPVLVKTTLWPPNLQLLAFGSQTLQLISSAESWQLGSITLIGSVSLAIYLILQVPILTRYPAPLSVAAFACLFGAMELAILSIIFERDSAKWFSWTIPQIYCVAYAGIIGTALVLGTYSWGVFRGGPVTVAVYEPLKMVFICILAAALLHQPLHVGSFLGVALVIFGIYFVLWGREEQRRTDASLTDHLWSANTRVDIDNEA